MLNVNEYLPIGSIVLLKGGLKKAMIIGIIQSTKGNDGHIVEYDYIGVMYPEGFLNTETMFMFNHNQITDVVYRGYENPERKEFMEKLEKNITLAKDLIEKMGKDTVNEAKIADETYQKQIAEDIF